MQINFSNQHPARYRMQKSQDRYTYAENFPNAGNPPLPRKRPWFLLRRYMLHKYGLSVTPIDECQPLS
jgi:hypothetical protein